MEAPNTSAANVVAPSVGRRTPSNDTHWTFLTNHALAMLCIARDPNARIRDIASSVGVTERAAQRIVADLADAGYITRTRVGRRNTYQIHKERPFRHPEASHRQVGSLLDLLTQMGAMSFVILNAAVASALSFASLA